MSSGLRRGTIRTRPTSLRPVTRPSTPTNESVRCGRHSPFSRSTYREFARSSDGPPETVVLWRIRNASRTSGVHRSAPGTEFDKIERLNRPCDPLTDRVSSSPRSRWSRCRRKPSHERRISFRRESDCEGGRPDGRHPGSSHRHHLRGPRWSSGRHGGVAAQPVLHDVERRFRHSAWNRLRSGDRPSTSILRGCCSSTGSVVLYYKVNEVTGVAEEKDNLTW